MKKNAKKDGSLTLSCFNPAVTLATFVIELIAAAYVVSRYRKSKFGRISALILLLLAGFQLSEYLLCTIHVGSRFWTQTAFLCITFLPALAFHLVSMAARPTPFVRFGYIAAGGFSAIILFVPSVFLSTSCTGRFVIFDALYRFMIAYGVYYLGFIALGMGMLGHALAKRYGDRDVAAWLLAAYASFVVPTLIVYGFFESSRAGFSSIMCGFAIVFALILTFKILPLRERRPAKKG